jgi:lysophospholipase L1-like esterase
VSKASGGMTFSNFAIAEKRYDIIPMKINTLAGFGDSIMYGSGATDRLTTSWFAKLTAKLKEYNPTVITTNLGQAGWTTGETLNNQVVPNVANAYDVAIIQCGTNDGRTTVGKATTYTQAIANLTAIIKHLKSYNTIPILCTTTPYSPDIVTTLGPSYDNTSYWYNVKINGLIRQLAAKEKIRIIDNYSLFNNDLTLIGSDLLHPTDIGHDLIYQNALNVITNKF